MYSSDPFLIFLLPFSHLVFTTALIKLIFYSTFLAVSSTCGLNYSDLSKLNEKIEGTNEWYDFICNFDGVFPI